MDNIKSKIYANTLASIRENELLSEEKYIRLSDADFSDAVKMLRDYGYGTASETNDAGSFVTSNINSLILFVEEECPSQSLKNFILNQFRYGNAKLLYKARFVSVNPEAYYETDDLELMRKADNERNYADLPLYMQEAFKVLDDRSEDHALTAKEIDIVFTRAMNEDNLKLVAKCGSGIRTYYRKKIDLTDLITTLRCRRLHVSENDCKEMLLDGGFIDKDYFTHLLGIGDENFEEELKKSGYWDIISTSDLSDLTGAEQRMDDFLIDLTKRQLIEYTSCEPFLRYFLLQMKEFGMVKYLLISLKNGNREVLKRRLKELYDSDR